MISRLICFAIGVLLVASECVSTAATQIVYVKQKVSPASTQDGSSWANAYRELRTALNAVQPTANNVVEIWVAKGTYLPAAPWSSDRSAAFVMKSHLRILGGFTGFETSDLQRTGTNITVLSGDIGAPQSSRVDSDHLDVYSIDFDPADPAFADNCYNVVRCTNVSDVVLDQLLITGGHASASPYVTNLTDLEIQGMLLPNMSPTNAIATAQGQPSALPDNRVVGGGLFCQNVYERTNGQGELIINNCIIVNNYSAAYGGGIGVFEANMKVAYTRFHNNVAEVEGGAVWGMNQLSDFLECDFTDNEGGEGGGAVSLRTIASDKTMPDFKGSTDAHIRESAQLVTKFTYTIPKQVFKLENGTSVFHKAKNLGTKIRSVFKTTIGPKLPLTMKIQRKFNAGVKYLKSTSAVKLAQDAYALVQTAVMIGDGVYDICAAFGADTNNVHAQNWKLFSNGFNTYATPEGLAQLLAVEIYNAMGGPALDDLAFQVKSVQLNFYNQSRYQTFRLCRFNNNKGAQGGAIYSTYDNVHIENCSFDSNIAENGGAIMSGAWTTPIVMSSWFYRNFATTGHSGMANVCHSRAQILNCTFAENYSGSKDGYCIGSETGSEIKIVNSILWGNTNLVNAAGADIFTATRETLVADIVNPLTATAEELLDATNAANVLEAYDTAGGSYGDYIGITEVTASCVQSLGNLHEGNVHVPLFPHHTKYPQNVIDEILANYATGTANGTLESYGFIRLGEGYVLSGNTSANPQLTGVLPSTASPVIDAGNDKRFNNGILNSLTGVDAVRNERLHGGSIDMGAIEFQGFSTNGGGIIYVRADAIGNNSGIDWANAKTNLAETMLLPNAEIWVAAGTYYPTDGTDRNASFRFGNNVQVYGGFRGDETLRNQRNPKRNVTILSGNIGNPNLDSDNSFNVVFNPLSCSNSVLDGFTITKGRGNSGSGMDSAGANALIQNCRFVDNVAGLSGGGLNNSGSATVLNCEFLGNQASVGGALYSTASLRAESCFFTRNSAGSGGAVALNGATSAKFYNSLFVSNSIPSVGATTGAAIYSSATDTRIYNCTFSLNTASVSSGSSRGGGAVLFVGSQPLQIENSIFWNNSVENLNAAPASTEQQQISYSGGVVPVMNNNLIQGLSGFASLGSANISKDPLFADATTGNFSLHNYSPAVDAGLNKIGTGYPMKDLAGSPRVASITMDMGAYEFQGKPMILSSLLKVTSACFIGGVSSYVFELYTNDLAGEYYHWEVDRNDGQGFVQLYNDGAHTGAFFAQLTVSPGYPAATGFRYRLRRSADIVSDPVTLRISPPVIYVKANATGLNNGTSWADAYTSLQSALTAAAPCTEIWVAAGKYYPTTSPTNRDAAFSLPAKVPVYGGFNGTETLLSQRNWLTNVTVLSARISGSYYDFDNSKHIIVNDGSVPTMPITASSVLDGFTLEGATDGSILNIDASPTIQNCVFIDHGATAIVNTGTSAPASLSQCIYAHYNALVCNPDAGTTFSLKSSNDVARTYQWQVDTGGGFITASNGPQATVSGDGYNSTLFLSPLVEGASYRFLIPGTGYVSPSFRPYFGTPTVMYVNAAAVGGTKDGTSWANAYTDLALAISNATDCVEIWVARGTYFSHPDPTYLTSFELKSGLALYGGFAGTETNRSQRNWTLNPTILATRTNISVINNFGRTAAIDFSSILDGFVFTNNTSYAVINNDSASPIIRNCFFTRNSGICIANQDSQPIISACTFSNNTAQAIYNRSSSPSISGCVFTQQSTSFEGAAIRNSESSPTIDGSVFYNNTAGWGGAIANVSKSSPLITRCIFKNNSSGNGGAIYNMIGTSTTVRNSLFYNNSAAQFRGGAISEYGTNLTVASCTFYNNSALLSGGGIYLQGTSATVLNSIFWHNATRDGNSTESGQIDRHTGTLWLTNSVVEGFATLGGTNNIAYDPLFADIAAGNFQLNISSPAVDAGKNDGTDSSDLAGHGRIQGTAIDIGAYEYTGTGTNVLRLVSLPEPQSTCEGTPVAFTIKGIAGTNYSYLWQVDTGSGFTTLTTGGAYTITTNGADNSSTLSIASPTYAMNGYRYRASISTVNTPSALLEVTPPQVYYVRLNATGSGDGLSWQNAFTNLQTALNSVADCSQVWVAAGSYTATNAQGGYSLALKSSVKFLGGFVGTETNLNQRNWTNNVTRLVGASNRVLFQNNGYASSIDSSAVLDGFTLTGGENGVMVNNAASPTIRNCIFEEVPGLSVFNSTSSDATFINCTFRNNTDTAVVNANCSPLFTNCVFLNNDCGFSAGAAIQSSDANPTIVDCTFIGNTSDDVSGAVDSRGGTTIISRSVFNGNSAQQGGAISLLYAYGEVRNCLFVNNSARWGGGAISLQQSPITIRNCAVVKNSSSQGGGGGILMESGTATVVNSIFWQNRDRSGSSAIESGQIYTLSGSVAVSRSCLEGLSIYSGNNNIKFDPLFQNVVSDFTLTRHSPLIDAGNSSATGGETQDLNHAARVFGAAVDLGAYELADTPLDPLALLETPASQTVCVGRDAFFSVTGYTNSASDFGWEENIGTNNYNIANDATHRIVQGGNTSTMIVSNLTAGTHQYRFYIASQGFISQPFTLTVTPPEVIYVNAAATGNQSGTNWAGAYTNLQAALNVAFPCTEIWVARGTYSPASGKSFSMPSGTKIYGGFFGNETLLSQRNWSTNQSILLGSANAAVIYNIGYDTPVDQTATLDGFTVTSSSGQFGINNQQASPTIRNCRFVNNSRSAIVNWSGSAPLIANCVFTNNNEAAIHNGFSSVVITNCTFSGNHDGSVINFGGTATISYCLFENNTGVFASGGVYDKDASSLISWCTFRGNSAGSGGAVVTEFSTTRIVNSLFHDNSSYIGGALDNAGSTLTLINCTVAENYAAARAGGVSLGGGTNEILNTIFWNNTAANGFGLVAQMETGGGTLILSNSCVQGWTNLAAGNIGFDPLFTGPSTNNFRPARNSPVIDAGNNQFAAAIPVDLDGYARLGWSAVDIGGYESSYSALPVKVFSQLASQTVCPGETVIFTVIGTNGSGGTFEWNYDSGSGWTFLNPSAPPAGFAVTTNSNASTVTITNVGAGLNGYKFRFGVPETGYTSEPATLTVNPPSVIYVNASMPPGGDGRSWSSAFNNLQTALQASSGCRPLVWVAQGTYFPPSGGFDIPPGIAVYGGFVGTETNLNQRDWLGHATILNGDIGSPVWIVNFDSSSNTNTVFDGFTVKNAKGGTGGGLNVFNANPTIRNCAVSDNVGTALYIQGNPWVENCSFLANSGADAAITMYSSSPTIRNCTIRGNGGIGIDSIYSGSGSCSPKIVNCLVTGNGGGGMSLMGPGSSLVVHCTVSGNLAPSVGGILVNGANATIYNSILWNNRSTLGVYSTEQTQLKLLGVGGSISLWNSCVEEYTDPPSVTYNDVRYDPLFVSGISAETAPTTAGNFHLQTCSPLINAGYNFYSSGIPTDLDGMPRTNGIVDMGAYEFPGAAGTPLIISTNPASFVYCSGGSNIFQVGASGSGLNYQWEINRQDGTGFVSFSDSSFYSGTASNILTINNASVAMNENQFRCVVVSGTTVARSKSATLTVNPTRWFVNGAAVTSGDGTSWAQAFRTVQEALANTNLTACQAEIWVARGDYAGGITLRSGVAIYGGFVGTEASVFERNWTTNLTRFTNGSPAVTGNNVDSSAALDGFYVIGGGVSLANSSATVANCSFATNSRAIYLQNSSSRISNCVFTFNGSGSLDGSCIYIYQSTPVIDRCEFRANQANAAAVFAGAGSTVTIANSVFSGNVGNQGAGVFANNDGSSVTGRNCTFVGNRANFGGAIYAAGAVYLYNSILWHNDSGSGFDQYSGNVFPTYSHIEQNSFGTPDIDPLFAQVINAAAAPTTAGDFHLTICSTMVNAGTNSQINGFTSDRDGNARVFGGLVDLGAYEFQQTVLRITNQPISATGAFTAPVQFSISATLTNVLYQWQVDHGSGFVDVLNDSRHVGATNRVLLLTNTIQLMDSWQYRCRVQSLDSCVVFSDAAAYRHSNIVASSTYANTNNAAPNSNIGLQVTGVILTNTVNDNSIAVHAMETGRLRSTNGDFSGISVTTSNITIDPANNFKAGERIFVTASKTLQVQGGYGVQPFIFEFRSAVNSSTNRAYLSYSQIATNSTIHQIAVGDLNRDGSVDVVLATDSTNLVWLNNGSGTLTNSGQSFGGNALSGVAVGDMDSDGWLDIVALNQSGTVTVWRNNHNLFATGQTFGSNVRTIALGDFNGDGGLDIVAGGISGIEIWINSGTGSFTSSGLLAGSGDVASLDVGDLDRDGDLDVFSANALTPSKVWLNDGLGVFSNSGASLGTGGGVKVAVGDVNGDGHLDAVVAMTNSSTTIWLNNGNGTFALPKTDVTQPGDTVTCAPTNVLGFPVQNAIDNNPLTVYMSTSYQGSITVRPSRGASIASILRLTSAPDNPGDDPRIAVVLGSNDGFATDSHTLLNTNMPLFSGRTAVMELPFLNTNAYTHYRVTFADTVSPSSFNVQIGEVELLSREIPRLGVGASADLSLGDIDGDGKLDVWLSRADGRSEAWLNDGSANFTSRVSDRAAISGASALADLDGDGDLDLVEARGGNSGIEISRLATLDQYVLEDISTFLATNVFTSAFSNASLGQLTEARLLTLPVHGVLSVSGTPIITNQALTLSSLTNLKYLSATNFFGADSFTWQGKASGSYATNVFRSHLLIQNVEDVPVATNDVVMVAEGGTATALTNGAITVLWNDRDVDGDSLTAILLSPPAHGSVTLNSDGTFLFIHDGTEPTADSFTYQINDGQGGVASATVTILVTNSNDAPTDILLSNNSVAEGAPTNTVIGNLSAVDSDAGDSHTFALVAGAGSTDNNSFSLVGNTLKTASLLNFTNQSSYSVRIRATDIVGGFYEKALVIYVRSRPIANDQSVTNAEDALGDFILTASDLDGDPATFAIVTQPQHGYVILTDSNATYHPETNYFGSDSFTFRANDGLQDSLPATVSINVTPVNDPPVAYSLSATDVEDTLFYISLVGSDLETNPITFSVVSGPTHGTVTISNWTALYRPATNYNGTDSFNIVANDGALDSEPATISLTITPANDPPQPISRTVGTYEDFPVSFALTATDPENDFVFYTVVTPPAHGTLSGTPPSLSYTPSNNFFGTDSFTFSASDGVLTSPTNGAITIQVTNINDFPQAVSKTYLVRTNTPLSFTLEGSDIDGDSLSFSIYSQPFGTLSGTPPNLTYQPPTNYEGNDSFFFAVGDGHGGTNYGEIQLKVRSLFLTVNDSSDNGPGTTLRAAIAEANLLPSSYLWTIKFSPSLAGQTISLSTIGDNGFGASALVVSNQILLAGETATNLTIARDNSVSDARIFRVANGAGLTARNLTLRNGVAHGGNGGFGSSGGGGGAGRGGALFNEGT